VADDAGRGCRAQDSVKANQASEATIGTINEIAHDDRRGGRGAGRREAGNDAQRMTQEDAARDPPLPDRLDQYSAVNQGEDETGAASA